LGVVFSVQARSPSGDWKPIFRRGLMRRARDWEQWDIPIESIARENSGKLQLRFITDSYTRAQERNAPTWKWALWGQPRIVRIGAAGKREVLYDFAKNLDQARAFTRLDQDGREHPFSAPGEDATGATFKLLGPDPMARMLAQMQTERTDLQWISGFKKWHAGAPHQGAYTSYLGEADSHWSYAAEGEVAWETDTVQKKQPTALLFVGSTDFSPARAELWCDDEPVITFDTGINESRTWRQDGCELRYLRVAEIPNKGISGIYILELPESKLIAARPLRLAMRIPAKSGGWVMCHGFPDTLQAVRQQLRPPDSSVAAIAAFTPHKNDLSGITIGEYAIRV